MWDNKVVLQEYVFCCNDHALLTHYGILRLGHMSLSITLSILMNGCWPHLEKGHTNHPLAGCKPGIHLVSNINGWPEERILKSRPNSHWHYNMILKAFNANNLMVMCLLSFWCVSSLMIHPNEWWKLHVYKDKRKNCGESNDMII